MSTKKSILPRIVLDCVLIAVLITLFSKNVVSLMYHEVVGLIILGLFLIHIVFNRKWVGAVASKLSRRKLTGKSRAMMLSQASSSQRRCFPLKYRRSIPGISSRPRLRWYSPAYTSDFIGAISGDFWPSVFNCPVRSPWSCVLR